MKISTKQYVDNQVCWVKELFNAELKSVRDAVNKVEQTNSRAIDKVDTNNAAKFEAQNEWRGQFKDQTGTFVTKRELLWAVALIVGMLASVLGLVLSSK